MLTYLSASRTLDFVIEGIEEYTGVRIISDYSEDIRNMIINVLGSGVTIYPAKGGYSRQEVHNEYDVLFNVITRL